MALMPSEVPVIFESSRPGRRASSLPALDVPETPDAIPAPYARAETPLLPEMAELDLVRHYTRLSQRNYGIDLGFYPLGSCSMKYNPKMAEDAAALPGFRRLHPLQPASQTQGLLALLVDLERTLCAVTGMRGVTFQPAAGAHGELTGLLMMRAYHAANGDHDRTQIIIPDSAHGTNPASVRLGGFEVVEVASGPDGLVDVEALRGLVGPKTAGLMITNPNTLGLFESQIAEIASLIHGAGGLLYYDGANLNAIVGHCRPGDMGFDIVHMNLHKTFATPHGGGGPGAGPLSVSERLVPFLPSPRPVEDPDGTYRWDDGDERSIGRVHTFAGNIGILVRAASYVRALGAEGLRHVSERAVLNANYVAARLRGTYEFAFDGQPMHEFVLTAVAQRERGARAMDIAKRIIDYGFHPPTVYFPLVVEEAMMVEPTETESIETLDAFVEAMLAVDREIDSDPHALHEAPKTAPISRPDEARAARTLRARWTPNPA